MARIRDLVRAARGTARGRDLVTVAAYALLGVLLVAVGLVDTWRATAVGPGPERWWFLLPLAAICAVQLGRRRRPLLALGAGAAIFAVDAAMGGTIGVMLVLIDLIYAAALFSSARAVRGLEITVGVVVASTTAVAFVLTGSLRDAVLLGLFAFAILGTPLWWGRAVRQQSDLAELARARARDLQDLASLREQEAVRAERTRMARDLHDAIAGNLSAIAIHTEAALAASEADDAKATFDPALRTIRAASVASLEEMRSMILLLRTGDGAAPGDGVAPVDGVTADADGGSAASGAHAGNGRADGGSGELTSPARLGELDDLLALARARGLRVRADVAAPPDLPAAADQAAYRIVQEALTNAAVHAPGADVDVVIAGGRTCTIEVRSRGARLSVATPVRSGGLGLTTMRERAEALGGTFAAGPVEDVEDVEDVVGPAWLVTASIPTGRDLP